MDLRSGPIWSGCGSLDMYEIVKALHDNGFNGYIPSGSRKNDLGRDGKSRYGLYDRALGATYINGLWEAESASAK